MHSSVIQRGIKRRSEEFPGLALPVWESPSASANWAALAEKHCVCFCVVSVSRPQLPTVSCYGVPEFAGGSWEKVVVTHTFSHDGSNGRSDLFSFYIEVK